MAGLLHLGALALCAAPSLLLCTKFLWDWKQLPDLLLWCLLPLNLVPLLLSHARPLYDLGAAGLVAAVVHLVLARRVRRFGQKYV